MNISIVTPVFNRATLMHKSLQSSLALVNAGIATELVVVDDASTDDTVAQLRQYYSAEINDGRIKFSVLPENLGVAGAKNAGAALAGGDWIIFMDSDDWFVADTISSMLDVLRTFQQYDVVFFRCRDQRLHQLIGESVPAKDIRIRELLNGGTPGECLPVVKRRSILAQPYPTKLRGSEGLTYLQILKNGGRIHLSDLVVREYEDMAVDRLSSRQGLRKRAGLLCQHNICLLRYWRYARFKTMLGWFARIGYYGCWSVLNKIKGR